MESLNSNSQEREMHQLQMQDKAKEKCMESFRLLHSHLKVLSIKGGFERACVALFDQDNQTFTESLLLNLDNLEKQLDREEFQETKSIGAFRVLMKQFQTFINFRYCFDDFDGAMIRKSFLEYTRTEIQQFRDTLIQHMKSVKKSIDERAQHKRENNRRVNDRVMQSKEGKVDSSTALDAGLVVTESNETESERHVSSSRSGKDTHAEDADINSVNDKQPLAEVQLTVQHDTLANEQQHSVQSEPIYDTHLLEKVDRNTIPDSTNMCHRGGEIEQNAEKCQDNEKLHKENEHLKQTYKDLYDSIKKTRVQTKDHNDSLIAQINKVNSRAKIQPNKTRNSNKPVDPTSHTQKPGRKIVTGHSFSPNKSSAVHEKTNTPRSYLRWIPTGRIFNTAGLKWVPTGTTFTSSTTKVDCELPNGSNDCITNPYKCDQTLNVSAGTLNLSAGTFCNPEKERLRVCLLKKVIYQKPRVPGIYAPLLKEKKSVRFSALYLQKKRNLLVS
ncbi:hypothetical protein Tco_0921940 [Tanacetum coccineum]|uniref:FH2 domain-containing protein n=1 Tax=Tanacetum coccineum TaxID=301880 RepID=A0ABQ5CWP4_9ASTR